MILSMACGSTGFVRWCVRGVQQFTVAASGTPAASVERPTVWVVAAVPTVVFAEEAADLSH